METDEELFQRARAGDMAAFDRLYARHERRLFGFILRLLGERRDAEEILHDVILSAFRARHVELEPGRFAAWLYRIARNACANKIRSRRRGAQALQRLGGAEEPSAASAEDLLREEQRTLAVASAVERLPQGLASVFHLRTAGLSYDGIAEALGIPVGTVKSRMHALVQHLRGELDHDL